MVILSGVLLMTMVQSGSPPSLATAEILQRMMQMDADRRAALGGYSGIRHYRFENKKYNKHAEMTVRMSCGGDGTKKFEVVAENGSRFVRNHILRKMVEAEEESSQKRERYETRIVPDNYNFRLIGTEISDGRDNYVMEVSPKNPSKYSIRGRIWVDAEDFAIARIEGQPAKSPSFWIRNVQVVQRYGRTGRFWLPAVNRSVAQARIFGETEVVIEYSDYLTSIREAQARGGPVRE